MRQQRRQHPAHLADDHGPHGGHEGHAHRGHHVLVLVLGGDVLGGLAGFQGFGGWRIVVWGLADWGLGGV